jgi:uncharacterized protein (AIM24 family)
MPIKTVAEFVAAYKEKDVSTEAFELENQYLLEVRLNGSVWAKSGAMVARTGQVKFTRQGLMEQGLGNLLKKAVSGEGMVLMKMEGQGRVYLADAGKKITLLRLDNETIFANGNDVLALETGIENKITMMKRIAGMMSGGLFNVKLSGSGIVAITSHYDPLILKDDRSQRHRGLVGQSVAGDRDGHLVEDAGRPGLGREHPDEVRRRGLGRGPAL